MTRRALFLVKRRSRNGRELGSGVRTAPPARTRADRSAARYKRRRRTRLTRLRPSDEARQNNSQPDCL